MMPIAASKDELGSGDDDSAALTAMLSGLLKASGCTGGLPLLPNAQG